MSSWQNAEIGIYAEERDGRIRIITSTTIGRERRTRSGTIRRVILLRRLSGSGNGEPILVPVKDLHEEYSGPKGHLSLSPEQVSYLLGILTS